MASNFQLLSYRNKDSLNLQLYGDLDGNSAFELINTLKKIQTQLCFVIKKSIEHWRWVFKNHPG